MPATPNAGWVSLLSPVLVVLGWIIVNWQNNQRETRKEIRAGLESLYKSLDDLEAAAIRFHTAQAWDGSQANALSTQIQRVIKRINIFSRTLNHDLTNECVMLRRAITLKNFDQSNHQALSHDDDTLLEIPDARDCIFHALESAFHHRFLS